MKNIEFFFSSAVTDGKISSLAKGILELEELKSANLKQGRAYAILLWTNIDLLSRLYSGQLHNQRAMKRIKDFLREFFPHERRTTSTLLLFRNACMHSVTLLASDSRGVGEIRFSIVLEGPLMEFIGRTHCKINVVEMENRLLTSVEKYRKELLKNENLKNRFEKVFQKMGYTHV